MPVCGDERVRSELLALALSQMDAWAHEATLVQQQLDALRGSGMGGQAALLEPMAVIVITVQRDRIQQTARLLMGTTYSGTQNFQRRGEATWSRPSADWMAQEDHISLELAEYMDGLELPTRVADMLPCMPSAGSDSAARAAQEVDHA
ncbi:MAG TPA: hypothetical protein ACQGQH_08175 [Xylella sp.]